MRIRLLIYVFFINCLTIDAQFHEIQKIWSPSFMSSAYFGYELDTYGDKCAIVGKEPHVVEVRKLVGDKWEYLQTFYDSDISTVNSVCMNGEFIAYGKPNQDSDGIPSKFDQGSVYIYRWDGNKYNFFQRIISPMDGNSDFFGNYLQMQGNRILIGIKNGSTVGVTYTFNGINFVLEQYIVTEYNNTYVQYELDSNFIFLGLPYHAVAGSSEKGIVEVKELIGGVWTNDGYLTASDGAAYDRFGMSLDFADHKLIVGADQGGIDYVYAGGAYLFEPSGTSWTQTNKFVMPFSDIKDYGIDVAINSNIACISGADGDYIPCIYYFKKSGGFWVYQQTIYASDYTEYDNIGNKLGINGNFLIAAASDVQNYSSEPGYVGAVYVNYLCIDNTTTTIQTICAGDSVEFSGTYYNTTGVYSNTVVNIYGCDSITILNLNVIDIDENVVVSPTELTADVTGETFQWYDCSTGAAIAGANSNIYIPAVTGNYKCLINKGVCSVTTDCYFFEVPGCSTPSGLSAINITTSSAKIIWDNIPDATKYQVQYRPTGTIAWYSVNATTNSKTISSLLSGISYDYRVKTICGALSSPYTPILTFTTL